MWLLSKINKKITLKIWMIVLLVVATFFASFKMNSSTNEISELTKTYQTKIDSMATVNEQMIVDSKIKSDSTIAYYVKLVDTIEKEEEHDKSKIITIYKDGKISSKTEYVDVVKWKEKEIKVVDKQVIKEYETEISNLEKINKNLEISFKKFEKDSTVQKYNKFVKNQLNFGTDLSMNSELNIDDKLYVEYNRNISKLVFSKVGINHKTIENKAINSFTDINKYNAYVGIGFRLNF